MPELDTETFSYDPFAAEVMANPLPYYRVLRQRFPVYYMEKYDCFAISRFADVYEVLGDSTDTFLSTEGSLPGPADLVRHNEGALPDPPTNPIGMHTAQASRLHGALRQAHGRPLRPGPVSRMEDDIRRIVVGLLGELLPRRRFDAVRDFAGVVSATVACRLFQLPESQAAEVMETVSLATRSDPVYGGVNMTEIKARMVGLVLPVIQRRRAEGVDGSFHLLDGLLEFEIEGRRLSDEEVGLQLVGLMVGANETLPKVFGHGLMVLEQHPQQLAEIRSDLKANVPRALEEIFRFCGPAQWFARTVRKPVVIAGTEIRPGQRIIALIQSANRDEREFIEPESFIWDRAIPRTLAFGHGPHFCIGVHLARLEGRILLEEWLTRVADYRTDSTAAVRTPSSFQWGFTSVPVEAVSR